MRILLLRLLPDRLPLSFAESNPWGGGGGILDFAPRDLESSGFIVDWLSKSRCISSKEVASTEAEPNNI